MDEGYDDIRNAQLTDLINLKNKQSDNQRWLVDDIDEIRHLQNSLRGVMLNSTTNQMEAFEDSRLMNDQGARVLTEMFLLPISKQVKLSNFDPDEIKRRMKRIMKTLDRHLLVNEPKYDFDYRNQNLILELFETVLLALFNRALYGAEQERLTTTSKVINKEEVRTYPMADYDPQMQQEKKGRSLKDFLPF